MTLAQIEMRAILLAFAEANGNKRLAAKMLGISRATLYRKLKRYRDELTPTICSAIEED